MKTMSTAMVNSAQPLVNDADPMLDVAPYLAAIDELPYSRRPQHRYHCSQVQTKAALGKVKCGNGITHYKAFCLECGGKGSPLSASEVAGLDDDSIPVISDHTILPCERCGSTKGSEVHHWAPRHLFSNAHDWPTSYLCRPCHVEWHAKVTPNMNSRKAAV